MILVVAAVFLRFLFALVVEFGEELFFVHVRHFFWCLFIILLLFWLLRDCDGCSYDDSIVMPPDEVYHSLTEFVECPCHLRLGGYGTLCRWDDPFDDYIFPPFLFDAYILFWCLRDLW